MRALPHWPDLGAVGSLCTIRLIMRRRGLPVVVMRVSPQLRDMVMLSGLTDVLRDEAATLAPGIETSKRQDASKGGS